ncbi:unnamed protein product [Clonostachys rosea]|uniref:Fungal STAND N-terminal Goodbye domain-containing protein n=1 Tax=Bionectria ochroleuca TaxID=29856 RepID=A0ABY6UW70_BIOOC|nr:unnamed protein product [Clonostachys rosea]
MASSSELDKAVNDYKITLAVATKSIGERTTDDAAMLRKIKAMKDPTDTAGCLDLVKFLERDGCDRQPGRWFGPVNQILKSMQYYGPVVDTLIRLAPPMLGTACLNRLKEIKEMFADLYDCLSLVNIYKDFAGDDPDVKQELETFNVSLVKFFTIVIKKCDTQG